MSGKPWRTPTLRALPAPAGIAGLRDHQGKVIGPAVWEAITTEQTRPRILSRLYEQKASGRRSPRRYLLSGLLRCHKCDHTLYNAAREDVRRGVCLLHRAGPRRRGGPEHMPSTPPGSVRSGDCDRPARCAPPR